MPNGNRPTEKEHFIPRMYLKGFAEICESGNEAYVWEYDLEKMKQIPKQVNIKTICFEKNLYELRSKSGDILAQNLLEKAFGNIESSVDKVIISIKEKSCIAKCLTCNSVLSEYEKSLLIIFMTSLKCRDPKTIQYGMNVLKHTNPEMSEDDLRNFTLMNLLPLDINPKWDKNTIIRTALAKYAGMAFQIGITDSDEILTSDRPVIEYPPDENERFGRPKAVVFPLTSRLVLYLFPIESVPTEGRNCFFKLSRNKIDDLYYNMSVVARRWIFSNYPVTDYQMKVFKDARKMSWMNEEEL